MHPRTRSRLFGPVLAVVLAVLAGLLAPAASADPPGPAPTPAGDAVWPLAPVPEVAEGFDPPETRWGAGHRGADLVGHVGQPVRAALAGRVSYAGTLAGRGVVVVDHGATRTTYEPVEAAVAVGDQVAAGDRIGTLQLGGSHCFPRACLHWGLRAGDRYLDPLTLVGAGPVRLLPLGEESSGAVLPLAAGAGRLPAWAAEVQSAPARPRSRLPPAGTGPLFRDGAGAEP